MIRFYIQHHTIGRRYNHNTITNFLLIFGSVASLFQPIEDIIEQSKKKEKQKWSYIFLGLGIGLPLSKFPFCANKYKI